MNAYYPYNVHECLDIHAGSDIVYMNTVNTYAYTPHIYTNICINKVSIHICVKGNRWVHQLIVFLQCIVMFFRQLQLRHGPDANGPRAPRAPAAVASDRHTFGAPAEARWLIGCWLVGERVGLVWFGFGWVGAVGR